MENSWEELNNDTANCEAIERICKWSRSQPIVMEIAVIVVFYCSKLRYRIERIAYMNKRQRKKKINRCYLGLTDEINLIGMTKDELKNVFFEREQFRKKYGYRKKYRSKSRLKVFYISSSQRQVDEMGKIFKLVRGRKCEPSHIIQSYEQIKALYNDN